MAYFKDSVLQYKYNSKNYLFSVLTTLLVATTYIRISSREISTGNCASIFMVSLSRGKTRVHICVAFKDYSYNFHAFQPNIPKASTKIVTKRLTLVDHNTQLILKKR
jgi:hypothetical protein